MRTLVVAEHDGHALRPASLACLAFAKSVAVETGGDSAWLVLGHKVEAVAASAATYAPVLVADSPSLAHPLAEPFARTVAHIGRQREFDLVCAAASTFAKDILP